MKIIHLYANNLDLWADAVSGTDIRLNGSTDLDTLSESILDFNIRDVVGLVVFANPLTKKTLGLIRRFDQLFVYRRLPIVLISDNITEAWGSIRFKVHNSDLYLLDSEENTISDIDIQRVMTTLLASDGNLYDLSACPQGHKKARKPVKESTELSDDVRFVLDLLKS